MICVLALPKQQAGCGPEQTPQPALTMIEMPCLPDERGGCWIVVSQARLGLILEKFPLLSHLQSWETCTNEPQVLQWSLTLRMKVCLKVLIQFYCHACYCIFSHCKLIYRQKWCKVSQSSIEISFILFIDIHYFHQCCKWNWHKIKGNWDLWHMFHVPDISSLMYTNQICLHPSSGLFNLIIIWLSLLVIYAKYLKS